MGEVIEIDPVVQRIHRYISLNKPLLQAKRAKTKFNDLETALDAIKPLFESEPEKSELLSVFLPKKWDINKLRDNLHPIFIDVLVEMEEKEATKIGLIYNIQNGYERRIQQLGDKLNELNEKLKKANKKERKEIQKVSDKINGELKELLGKSKEFNEVTFKLPQFNEIKDFFQKKCTSVYEEMERLQIYENDAYELAKKVNGPKLEALLEEILTQRFEKRIPDSVPAEIEASITNYRLKLEKIRELAKEIEERRKNKTDFIKIRDNISLRENDFYVPTSLFAGFDLVSEELREKFKIVRRTVGTESYDLNTHLITMKKDGKTSLDILTNEYVIKFEGKNVEERNRAMEYFTKEQSRTKDYMAKTDEKESEIKSIDAELRLLKHGSEIAGLKQKGILEQLNERTNELIEEEEKETIKFRGLLKIDPTYIPKKVKEIEEEEERIRQEELAKEQEKRQKEYDKVLEEALRNQELAKRKEEREMDRVLRKGENRHYFSKLKEFGIAALAAAGILAGIAGINKINNYLNNKTPENVFNIKIPEYSQIIKVNPRESVPKKPVYYGPEKPLPETTLAEKTESVKIEPVGPTGPLITTTIKTAETKTTKPIQKLEEKVKETKTVESKKEGVEIITVYAKPGDNLWNRTKKELRNKYGRRPTNKETYDETDSNALASGKGLQKEYSLESRSSKSPHYFKVGEPMKLHRYYAKSAKTNVEQEQAKEIKTFGDFVNNYNKLNIPQSPWEDAIKEVSKQELGESTGLKGNYLDELNNSVTKIKTPKQIVNEVYNKDPWKKISEEKVQNKQEKKKSNEKKPISKLPENNNFAMFLKEITQKSIGNDYRSSQLTLKKLSEKYDVCESTVRKYGKSHNNGFTRTQLRTPYQVI